ncbi:hypothetical protein MNBD_GAMMA12-3213 [hydrothermal vent metagenome]|uniref:Cell shape-determining protein MreC n=1 Tax=hydrothermal vent metagenome TaxID=652676 RepID=A0A3B0YTV0_9ZZZZ
MWADSKKHLRQSIADDVVAVLYNPIIKFVHWPSKKIESIKQSFETPEEIKKKHTALITENRNLRLRVNKLELLKIKIVSYQKLLRASREIREDVKLAEIFHITLDPKKQLVKINLGRTNCVIDDQPLIDAYGVMGQVVRARPYDSTVRLVTDQNHIMHVQFKPDPKNPQEEGIRTLARGTGKSRLIILPYLPKSAESKINIGDAVITSGLGDIYPHGYPVGKVIKILNPPESRFMLAYVKPSAHLDRTREALVVWTAKVYKRMNLQFKKDVNAASLNTKNKKSKNEKPVKRATVFGAAIKCQ